ncbi:hypothetical protein K1718_00075 [Roseibium porphyridii]|uniref:Helicase/UvrB N-terminal domain-containing protein n=1 Tax=Roseibium porphyridii TaxID=2866279 RepID=A0ABY8F4V2_9HYPH|nr:hypothetical protein [Roseibium sp. KMA01]WFE89794.1 hypothetical protein K1718_00075 [Roseibium sp. KMA01]
MLATNTCAWNPLGGKICINSLYQDFPPSHSLADHAFNLLTEEFKARGHAPSNQMLVAIRDVLLTLEAMAEERCPDRVFLSSLDPGVGKTSAVVSFIKALRLSPRPDHQDAAILICLGRLEQIEEMIRATGLTKDEFAVLTSDEELNALGSDNWQKARVLFTTQSRIQLSLQGRRFEQVSKFQYQGLRRQVVIWDETMLPATPITVNQLEISSLLQPISSMSPLLLDLLEQTYDKLRSCQDKGTITIPNLPQESGLDWSDINRLSEGLPEANRRTLRSLWQMSGQTVSVRRDGINRNTVLHFQMSLPEDFAPVLVLDASGRVRATYKLWEVHRGGLTRLRSASKDYSKLRIHHWPVGGGKSSLTRDFDRHVQGVAKTKNNKQWERWLVVHHKSFQGGRDFISAVKDQLERPELCSFLNWGSHDATNDYAEISNVILAGTLFYPPSVIEAVGRAAGDLPAWKTPFSEKDFISVQRGETAHVLLQAACRGSVRSSVGSSCGVCDLYVIGSKRSGFPEVLLETFPGCQLQKWRPIRRRAKGRVALALDYLENRFEEDLRTFVPFRDVQEAISCSDKSTFRKDIRKHPDFGAGLDELQLVEGMDGRYGGFVSVSYEALFGAPRDA